MHSNAQEKKIILRLYVSSSICISPTQHRVFNDAIDNYETSYRQQWDNLPEDYKLKMSKGIVAFEIIVTDLQAKKKLSQNRTDNEKKKIIETLSKSKDTNEQLIAEYMKTN